MNCPYTAEMCSLLAEALSCARDREFFSAGMWLHEAIDSSKLISDERKRKLAARLIEGACGAIEVAERTQTQTLIPAALYRMRRTESSSSGVSPRCAP